MSPALIARNDTSSGTTQDQIKDNVYNYFGYDPNLAAAIIMCIAFFISFLIGLINVVIHRKQIHGRFLFIFIFCPFAKMIGYALRSASSQDPASFNLFISSQFFLFLTPQLCAAAGYLTYAGLVFYVDEMFSLIGCKKVALIFLGSDIFSTAIQGGGAGQLFGSNANTWKIGAGLCLGGMLLEFLSFSTFSLVVLHFGWRYRQHKEEIPEPHVRVPIVDRIMLALYLNLGGQFVRAIFRVVEFSEFLKGVFVIPEVYLYLFDALPILVCTLAFSILLPWELDYGKAVGDVLETIEWGLLAPIVYPTKKIIRKQREKRKLKRQQLAGDGEATETQELSELPK